MTQATCRTTNKNEELVLVMRAQAGDETARTELVTRYLPRIRGVAAKHARKNGGAAEDYLADVTIAFIECLRTYSLGKSRYATHATIWASWRLYDTYIKAHNRGVNYPASLKDLVAKVRDLMSSTEMDERELVSWVHRYGGKYADHAQEAVDVARTYMLSLYDRTRPNEEGDEECLLDYLADEGISPEEQMVQDCELVWYREVFQRCVEVLDVRERYIIFERNKTPPTTFTVLGKVLNISGKRAQQLKCRAEEKIAAELERMDFAF